MDFTVMQDLFATCHSESAVLACDVHQEVINLWTRIRGVRIEREFSNSAERIAQELAQLKAMAEKAGVQHLLLVAEPTGVHHRVLMRTAKRMGMETAWVSPEHVSKMRVIETNDTGKTDRKDPRVIHSLARMGKTLRHRTSEPPYSLLREWNKLYEAAENRGVAAKCAIHDAIRALFPDLRVSREFKFGRAGQALGKRYGYNPYRIARSRPGRLRASVAKDGARMTQARVEALFEQARHSVRSGPGQAEARVLERRVLQLYEDLELSDKRKQEAKEAMLELYEAARRADPKLPAGVKGVVSDLNLARIVAESGPLSDFPKARQLVRFAGLNLRERVSGKYRGKTKISKKGRTLLRKVQMHVILPLVKQGALYGEYYARLRKSGEVGGKAMAAVARHFLKALHGWYRSGAAFDAERLFTCESQYDVAG